MRSRRELHGLGDRVHAHRRVAFQDGFAVHSNDDAVVGSCMKVNAFGLWREPHTVPANPVVPGRAVSLVDEGKVDGRDAFVDDRFGRGVAWIPIAAGEPGFRRQTEGRQPEQRQRDRSEPIPGACAECAGVPTAPDSHESGSRRSLIEIQQRSRISCNTSQTRSCSASVSEGYIGSEKIARAALDRGCRAVGRRRSNGEPIAPRIVQSGQEAEGASIRSDIPFEVGLHIAAVP